MTRIEIEQVLSMWQSIQVPLLDRKHLWFCLIFTPCYTGIVMYGCESWTIKKAEHQRSDAFKLWCWKTLFIVPWTARRSNQSILKEISPEYSFERLMMKLKLQYFGHLMWKANLLEKTLMLERLKVGGKGDDRGWDSWMASLIRWTWVWASSRRWWGQGSCSIHGIAKSHTQLSD